ncbi:MAG: hypothetical protein CBD02_04620 [Candidatus Pelagibacter sp. TMED142]|nr:MAG: hypothetical protein CBD02_04620 [Candidatus Pelagibacter sp. TMED142]|tara:strand:+ start:1748 stop:2299 length:552 start_codon:yes stop_codon:yes gene_type:complete
MGLSGSGKSHLAQIHAKVLNEKHGRESLVFDPRYSENPTTPGEYRAKVELVERWNNPAFITGDKEEFAEVVHNSQNCAVFIDESVEFFDKGNFTPGVAIITRGRHDGHIVACIGQHYYAFPPSVRNNMSSFYCFRVSHDIAKEIAKDAGDDAFRQAPKLRNRQCIAKIGDRDAFLIKTEELKL